MIGGAGVCGTEEISNLIVNRKESLGLPGGLEALGSVALTLAG
jgi:hypothetical protein